MKKKLPFWMLPASWGLKGKTRAVAEAEYMYEGKELEEKLAELNAETPEDKEIAKLAVKLKHEEITQDAHDKAVATIKKEPWVNVVKMGVNPSNVAAGFFELDWNDEFIIMLQENGYTGTSDEETVNKWFNDVCRTVLIQERADQDYGLQEQRMDVENVTKPKRKRTPKTEQPD
jgi:hypothetical protein